MKLELLLRDIKEQVVRDNFERVKDLFDKLRILDGDWRFFDVDLPTAGLNEIKHRLTFAPKDIILLSAVGDQAFFFKYQNFDRDHIYIYTSGPVRLRFFAGVLTEGVYGQSDANTRAVTYDFSPPTPIARSATIDFGSTPVAAKLFTITDSAIDENSMIMAQIAYKATNQDADEVELTPLNLTCLAKNGSFDLYANTSEGRAYGQFVVNYQVG